MSLLLSIFYFFYFSIVGVYVIFMPKVLAELSYSASEIGIIFAAAPLVRFFLPFLFIKGFELNRNIFNTATLLMVLSASSFYFFIEDFYKLLVSNIFLGIGMSVVLPFVEVIALDVIGKEKYGQIRLFGSIGFVLVALVLVKVLNSPSIALDFLLSLSAITAVVAFFIAKAFHKKEEKKGKIQNDINIFKDYKLWLGFVLMQLSFGAFYNFFTIYATDNGISLDTTIYLWTFGVFVEIVMLYSQGRFLKNNLLLILQMTTFITVIRWYLVYAFSDNLFVLYFSQSLHAFSFALFHSAAIAYLFHYYRHRALAQQFFSGISYGLGGFGGALMAGFIYDNYPSYLFLTAAFIAFGSFVFLSLWRREKELLGYA